MDVLWRMRHRGTDLMGSVLNVNSGDWIRRDSGVGAGIDSYYEYCLKAYILLGNLFIFIRCEVGIHLHACAWHPHARVSSSNMKYCIIV